MLLFGNFTISAISAIIIILFFGMGLHEFGHAFMADRWGDPTPRRNGKLTLNPLAHIDPMGWIWILLIGFGTAGSVAINPRLMRDSRWGSFWTSLAGPLANLIQAIVFGLLFRIIGNPTAVFMMLGNSRGSLEVWQLGSLGINPFHAYISLFLFIGVWYNLLLFFFNLLPLFPLDGYRVLLALLPGYFLSGKQIPSFIRSSLPGVSRFLQQPAYVWQEWQMVTYYVFMGLIILSFVARQSGLWFLDIIGMIISGPVWNLVHLLTGV